MRVIMLLFLRFACKLGYPTERASFFLVSQNKKIHTVSGRGRGGPTGALATVGPIQNVDFFFITNMCLL